MMPKQTAASLPGLGPVLAAGAAFDLVLGAGALLLPGVYNRLMHREDKAPRYWLERTGIIWLGLGFAQGWAAMNPRRERPALLLCAGLRLLECPADVVYRLRAPDLTRFGRLTLTVTPLLNTLLGAFYLYAWRRTGRKDR